MVTTPEIRLGLNHEHLTYVEVMVFHEHYLFLFAENLLGAAGLHPYFLFSVSENKERYSTMATHEVCVLSSNLLCTSDLWTHRRKVTEDFSTFLLRCLPQILSREGFSHPSTVSTCFGKNGKLVRG